MFVFFYVPTELIQAEALCTFSTVMHVYIQYWSYILEVRDIKRQHALQSQSAHPAAIGQKIQKYLLPYHQTTEQLLLCRL